MIKTTVNKSALSLLLIFCIHFQTTAADKPVTAGQSRFSEQKRVEYIVGNLPVIISAPHGGRLAPESIPDRTDGVILTDLNTDLLARDIAQAFHTQTGSYPHVIICHLKRTKVDCNRSAKEGVAGNAEAMQCWQAFHNFISDACNTVTNSYSYGIYIDLHAHGHPEARLELGYFLKGSQLKLSAADLDKLASRSSIRSLATRSGSSFTELVQGNTGFGALMEKRGYAAVPSPAHPHPGSTTYFNGGYNTRRYSSRNGGTIDALQIECPKKGVRDTDVNRKAFSKAFVESMMEYLKIHYNYNCLKQSCSRQL